MHSIAHFILQKNPSSRILYVTSEEFTNEVIEAIRNSNNTAMTKFREKYRNIDVLMIDDIQFISKKEVKDRIVENFQAKCTEMEGAAIAHGAYLNHIPYVIIRAISDKADGTAQVDYPTFEKQAITHSVNLMRELLPMI